MGNFDDWATDRRITLPLAQAFLADPDRVADAWLGDYLLWTSSGTSGERARHLRAGHRQPGRV